MQKTKISVSNKSKHSFDQSRSPEADDSIMGEEDPGAAIEDLFKDLTEEEREQALKDWKFDYQ